LIFAQRILEFTSGMDQVAFENDLKTQVGNKDMAADGITAG
jgi:hypothetical protein